MISDSDNLFQFATLDINLNDNSELRLLTNWKIKNQDLVNTLTIVLVSNNRLWKGLFEEWMLRERSMLLNLDYDDYCNSLKDAFASRLGPKNDIFTFEDGVLIWKKIVDVGSLISFGTFNLDLVDGSDLVTEIISSLLDANHEYRKSYDDISAKCSEVQTGWDDLKLQLNKLVETKDQLEKKLYAQFVAVLNEKKNKQCDTCRRDDL